MTKTFTLINNLKLMEKDELTPKELAWEAWKASASRDYDLNLHCNKEIEEEAFQKWWNKSENIKSKS